MTLVERFSMISLQHHLRAFSMSLVALAFAGCLKGDNRPVPGSVVVTAEASDATRNGLTTSDGWAITFERVLSAMGNVGLNNFPDNQSTSCNSYSDASYDRLFDFTKITSPQKVGLVYGLGECFVEYRLRAPSDTDLVEAGATQADVTSMRTQGTDAYAMDARISVRVEGHADLNGVTKRFDWEFRRGIQVTGCVGSGPSGYIDVVTLKANDAATLRGVVSAEELFRVNPDDSSPFEFGIYASADADGDGTITFDELANVPAPITDLGLGMGGAGGGMTGPNDAPSPVTLADLLYNWLFPRVARFAGGGPCMPRAR